MQTQNSPLPTKVTHEEILKAMEELQESLKNCLECCKTIRHEFEESEKQLKQQGKMPENIISEAGIEALDKMEQEPAYTHILKVFSDNYIDRFNREFNRLLYDESLLTDLEINLKRIGLNAARYKSLRETCKIVLKLFEIVLKEDAENLTGMLLKGERSQPLIVSEKDLGDHAHYRLENGELQIIDADLGIDIKEPFSSKPIEDKYASGKLKNRHYLKDGYLHGPSRFYGPDEQLLSESWYVRGKKQGKTRTWYLKGALHSFESHKNGEKEGLQTYYYPNGQIKTSLNYINGQLHGDVKLFFPNGQLKRELHFVQGKRHGFERIWNEIGTLLIEAEFDADKAVGTARKWYPNGNIAKEVIYEKGSDIAVSREWDEIGQMILTEKRQGIDYFDMVTKQTDKLTEALQQVLTQVTTVVPLMESVIAPEEKKKSENLWTQEIDNLCKGVDALAEINKKLAFETGLDVSNKEEAIWKGPASRREIEKEVDKMTKEMTKEMNAMQSALVNALGMLSKKISQLQAKAAAEKKAAEKAPENLPEKAPEKDPEKTKEKNDEPK
jgi:antitoxin component YwqK of YwqJK toxin-antitoxin module